MRPPIPIDTPIISLINVSCLAFFFLEKTKKERRRRKRTERQIKNERREKIHLLHALPPCCAQTTFGHPPRPYPVIRTSREQKRVRRWTALNETMNIYRFYPRGNASQVKRTRKNRRYFQSSLIFQRMDKQHAFLVKNSTRIPKRVSEDSHLFPSPGSLPPSLHPAPFIFGRRTGGREQPSNNGSFRGRKTRTAKDRVVCTRRGGVYSLQQRRGEGTYDITTGTWRIKCCTAYVMRDCRSACTTRDVLDSGLHALFFLSSSSFFSFSFLFQSTLLTANDDFDAPIRTTTSIDLVVWKVVSRLGQLVETRRFILGFIIGDFNDASAWRECL